MLWILQIILFLKIFTDSAFASPDPSLYHHPNLALSIRVPSGFEALTDPIGTKGVLLRKIEGGYPTLNIILQAGGYKFLQGRIEIDTGRIIEEYGRAGLGSIEITGKREFQVGGKSGLRIDTCYEYLSDKLCSIVFKSEGDSSHFLLTFVSRYPAGSYDKELFDSMLGSLSLGDDPGKDKAVEPGGNLIKRNRFILLIGVALFLVVALGSVFKCIRSSKPID